MSGIYVHIPFCKQACYYCNFHFATSLHFKDEMVAALVCEIEYQKDYLASENVETIYFGGGTPSLCTKEELSRMMEKIRECYIITPGAEISLEVNPDDITEEKLLDWKDLGINRLSIGIQSFFNEDLEWMNRAHSEQQAIDNLQLARKHFDNISIDLIYGTPSLTNEKWKHNVDTAISMNIPHLSCYALTVEPRTPLYKMIRTGRSPDINPEKQSGQFLLLMEWLGNAGYEHYEISNFSQPGRRSRHNSSYWQGKKYLGIGPSAHSFNGISRQWNIANNAMYTASIGKAVIPFEKEELTAVQKLNEFIMVSLRTIEGLDLDKLEEDRLNKLLTSSRKFTDTGLMKLEGHSLVLTKEGKLLADGITATLFF